jgi:peptidoglycan/LPS O-acetylase OafA/YrhL
MYQSIIRIALVTALLLLIPLVAMQFTDEVDWDLADFAVMGAMLFITGLLIDLAMKKMGKYRVVATIVIIVAFLWLWAELAVGLFTNWGS